MNQSIKQATISSRGTSSNKRLIAATNNQSLTNNIFSSSLPVNDSSFQTAVVDDDGCMEELPTPLFDNRTKINVSNRGSESHGYQYNVLSLYQQESQSYQLDAYPVKHHETTTRESKTSTTRVNQYDDKKESTKHNKKQTMNKTKSNAETYRNSVAVDKSRRNNSRICENRPEVENEYKHDYSQADQDILYKTFITDDSGNPVTESRETCEGFRAGIQWIIHSDTPGGHWLQPLKLVKGIEALEEDTDDDVNPTSENNFKHSSTNVAISVSRTEKRDTIDQVAVEEEDSRIKQAKNAIVQEQADKSDDKRDKPLQRSKSNVETSNSREQSRSRPNTRDRDGKITRSSSDITGVDESKPRRRRKKPLQDIVDTRDRPPLERQHSGQSLCQFVETSLLHQPQIPKNDIVEPKSQRQDNRNCESNRITKIDDNQNKKSSKKPDDGKKKDSKKSTTTNEEQDQKSRRRGDNDRTKYNDDSKHRADVSQEREESGDFRRQDYAESKKSDLVSGESKMKRSEKDSKVKDSKRKGKHDTHDSETQSDDYPVRQERISIEQRRATATIDVTKEVIKPDDVLTTNTKVIPSVGSNEVSTMNPKSKDEPASQIKVKTPSHVKSIEKLAKLNMSWDADAKVTDEEVSIDPLNGFIPHKVRHGEKKPPKKTETLLSQNHEEDSEIAYVNDAEDKDKNQKNRYELQVPDSSSKHLSRSASTAEETKHTFRKKDSIECRLNSMDENCKNDNGMMESEPPCVHASYEQENDKNDTRFAEKHEELNRRSSRRSRKKDPLESKSEHSTFSSARRHGSNDHCFDRQSDHGSSYDSKVSSLYADTNGVSKKVKPSSLQESNLSNSTATPCSNTQNSCSSGETSAVFSVGVGIQYLNQGNEAKVRHQQAVASYEMSFAQLNFNLFGTSEHQAGGVKFVDNDQVAAAAEVVPPPLEQAFVKLPGNEKSSREENLVELEEDAPHGGTKTKSKSRRNIESGVDEAAAGKKGQVVRSKSLFSSRPKSNDDSTPVSPMKAIRTFSLRRPVKGDEIPPTDKANPFAFRSSTKSKDIPEIPKKNAPHDEKGKEKKTKMKKFLSFGNASTDWGSKAALSCLIEDDDLDFE